MIRLIRKTKLIYDIHNNQLQSRWNIPLRQFSFHKKLIQIPAILQNVQSPKFLFFCSYSNSKFKHDFAQDEQDTHKNVKINYANNETKILQPVKLVSTSSHSNPKSISTKVKPVENIVNKYSSVPSLPSSLIHKLNVEVPETPSSKEVPSLIHRFFLGHFLKYLDKFHQSLATEMPDTFHMFNTFSKGFKEFVVDIRDYIKVIIKLSLPFYNLEDLSRRELELYYNMPSQMIQVFPVIAISSLPFAQNFALPVAYMLPKHLLCYHFWDSQQRIEFPVSILRKRLFNARPVFRSLQSRIDEVENLNLKRKCQSIFFSLGSGVHPTLSQILEVKELFSDEPFHLNLMWAQHVNGLLRLHKRSVWFRRRNRLREHARYIHCMDKALLKEGIEVLSSEQIRNILIFRGINPTGLSKEEMLDFLERWIFISKELNDSSYSLLLHLPILLGYNHPMNLHLIYS